MKRTTIAALGVLAVVVLVALWLDHRPRGGEIPEWTIPGYLPAGSVPAKSSTDLDQDDIDRIELTRKGTHIVLTRDGDKWRMKEPVDAAVEQYDIKYMLIPLQTPTESILGKRANEEDLPLYGLGPDERIEVKVFKKGKPFAHFIVGASAKSEEVGASPEDVDTWVLNPDNHLVFRMAGKDLHRYFDKDVNDLRDKKLFDFERADIARIVLDNPANTETPHIVVANVAPLPDKNDDEGKKADKSKEKKPEEWVIEEPKGYRAGTGVKTFAGSIAAMRALSFENDTTKKDAGLDGKDVVHLHIELRDGKSYDVSIGPERDDAAYAMVEGRDEIVKISKYTAKNLRKTLSDLRDKKVLLAAGLGRNTLTGVDLPFAGVSLRKEGGAWHFVRPAGLDVDPDAMDALARDVENWTVSEFLRGKPADYGLSPKDHPYRVVFHRGSDRVELLIGKERDGWHYVQMVDEPHGELWKVTKYMAKKFIGKTAADFRWHKIFSLSRPDFARIELHHPAETVVLEPKPQGDGEGKAKAAQATGTKWLVKRGDETIDNPKKSVVEAVITGIINLKAKHFFDRKSFDDAGLKNDGVFKVVVVDRAGHRHELWVSTADYQEEPYAAAPTERRWGKRVFTLNKFQVNNIKKKFKDFKP